MARPALEVADVFRDHGAAWRHANRGHVSLLQLKVMSAIENCRTAALGGHVARCEDCAHTTIAYNSCLMGNFRNGELATRCIRGSVDFGDLTLHYGQPLGPAISRREVKGSLPQSSWPGVLNGFELLVGIQAGAKFQWSQVSRLRSTTIRSEDLVSLRSAISRRPISAHRCCNGEQKAGRSTPNHLKNARLATEAVASSPLRKLPIRQLMGVAHYLSQPALPEVPGCGVTPMAGRPRSGAVTGAVLSRRVHP